jgi:hypothetical protein
MVAIVGTRVCPARRCPILVRLDEPLSPGMDAFRVAGEPPVG